MDSERAEKACQEVCGRMRDDSMLSQKRLTSGPVTAQTAEQSFAKT